jgi:hypothetical protein
MPTAKPCRPCSTTPGRGARWVLLGDFVGYGADPAWVVDRVRDLVRRRRDRGAWATTTWRWCGGLAHMRPEPRFVIDWTRAQLERCAARLPGHAADVAASRRPPLRACQCLGARRLGYIQGRIEAVRSLQATRRRYTFCGHVHEPRSCSTCRAPARRATSCPRRAWPSRCHRSASGWSSRLGRPAARRQSGGLLCHLRRRRRQPHLSPRALRPRHGRRKIRAAGAAAAAGHRLEHGSRARTRAGCAHRAAAGSTARAHAAAGPGDRRFSARGALHQGGMAHLWRVSEVEGGRFTPAADHEGAAHQGRRGPGHHRRLRGRADDHAGARARMCRSSSPRATSRASPTS